MNFSSLSRWQVTIGSAATSAGRWPGSSGLVQSSLSYSACSSGVIVTVGAPVGDGVGEAVGEGEVLGEGVGDALAESLSDGLADADGDGESLIDGVTTGAGLPRWATGRNVSRAVCPTSSTMRP
jgi:hypothetical protein